MVVATALHGEVVDVPVVGVQDLQGDVRVAVGDQAHLPLELGVTSVATPRGPVEPIDVRGLVPGGLDADVGAVGPIVPIAVACFHPVGVLDRVAQGLAVGEHPRVPAADDLHGEVVGVVVVRIGDAERRVGLRIVAVHDGRPHELGFTSGAPARVDVGADDVHVAFIVGVLVHRIVFAGVAAAALFAFAVVPAAGVEVGDAGHGLGRDGHGPVVDLLVEGQVQVRAGVRGAGGADAVTGVADGTDVVEHGHALAEVHVDLGEVSVAAQVATAVVDDHGVAVALVAVTVVRDLDDTAGHDGSDRFTVGVAAVLGEVQRVAIVAVLEAPVLVRAGVVALREHPPLPGGEGQGQVGRGTAAAVVHGVVAVAGVHVLVGTAHEHHDEGQDGQHFVQHGSLLLLLGGMQSETAGESKNIKSEEKIPHFVKNIMKES